ncbi:MAG TPA: pyruvate formate lyase family protein [Anaerolineae bacterium]|nr:pyruvate formate lyase family protein [Anaerolineae bacterium]
MDQPTARIRRLRDHFLDLESPGAAPELELLAARAWVDSAGEPWTVVRRAKETAAILRGMTPAIDADELLVGKYCLRPYTPEEGAELQRYREWVQPARPPVLGQRAHMAIDYDKLLQLGVAGLRRQVAAYRARLDLTRPADLEQDAFYRACTMTLDALLESAHRYAAAAEALANAETDARRRAELHEIAHTCRHVPELPARSFREAMQAIHFVTFCLCAGQRMHLFQLGRPDRYLLPFYRRDLSAGKITSEEAVELIDCLAILLSEYTPRGLAVGWMLGGRDASGTDICNELTELFLRSIGHIRLAYPCVGLCWTPDMPSEIRTLATELMAEGLGNPAMFNDEVIAGGLIQAGLPPAEACLYQHSTCVEITPIASSNVYVASPYINLLQCLHDVLAVPGLEVPEPQPDAPSRPPSFEALLDAYYDRLREAIRAGVIEQNTAQATRRYNGGFPLLSCFVNDCLARGLDIDHGGARHNWIEPSFVGLSNLVDSLAAIRQFVYEERSLSMEQLVEALRTDFEGQEELRLMLLHRAPKYGNDDARVDALAVQTTDWIRREVGHYRTYLGGAFHSGFFCWIQHERLGRITAASADGRRAGFPLGDGSGPAQGRERLGPTAAVLSATKWQHAPHLGGIAVNLKFSRPRDAAQFGTRLIEIVETYLERGGFEVQVNVVDKATLLSAQEHPEQYRDLIVRIGGYSDYFVGLSTEMQQEIIMRTEHEL